jgi:3-phosphoshikimate 1-carboxyvinyltransferase
VTTYEITPAPLRGVRVGADNVPSMIDELPLLACLAAHAEGETVISGAAELRVKESDRIATTVANLCAIGVDAAERPDGMVIVGRDAPLRGRVVTHGDHRIAMAFGILGRRRGNAIEVDDPDCVAVSFPSFWRTLDEVTR